MRKRHIAYRSPSMLLLLQLVLTISLWGSPSYRLMWSRFLTRRFWFFLEPPLCAWLICSWYTAVHLNGLGRLYQRLSFLQLYLHLGRHAALRNHLFIRFSVGSLPRWRCSLIMRRFTLNAQQTDHMPASSHTSKHKKQFGQFSSP
jgi:hypothetical protein